MSKSTLIPLCYPDASLAPTLSEAAVCSHHRGIQFEQAATATRLESLRKNVRPLDPAEESVLTDAKDGLLLHEFYWGNIGPVDKVSTPVGFFDKRLRVHIPAFRRELMTTAMKMRKPGWITLCVDPRDLNSHPEIHVVELNEIDWNKYSPVLVIDMWEHAYYQDFSYKKDKYLTDLWKHIDWSRVERRLLALERPPLNEL